MRNSIRLACIAIFIAAISSAAWALNKPVGNVLLTVSGPALAQTSESTSADFDEAMLLSLPQRTIKTTTPWHDGVQEFTGPDLYNLIEEFAPQATTLRIAALNDYSATVQTAFVAQYRPVLAIRHNGQPMRVREKGPLFVVFPYDSDPALRNETVFSWSVWQIRSIRCE
jgi:hypothetical protein